MQIDLACPEVVKVFGNNLDICLRLIGSRPESLALRCNANPYIISGFKQGLGVLTEELLTAICKDIGVSRELILKEHQSPAKAVRQFEEVFRTKGKLTASDLIGSNETRGDETVPPQLQLPLGKLNDPVWRQNFGRNIQMCLKHTEMTAASLAVRTEMSESQVQQILAGKVSLSNEDIEAIRLEIGLNTNDLIMDYGDNNRLHDELLSKLKLAGRIKPPKPAVEAEPEPLQQSAPSAPIPVAEAEVMQEELTVEPAIPATTIPAEELENLETETMTDTSTVIWKDDDITGTAGDRTFRLRDKEQRKLTGNSIRTLKEQRYDEDTWNEFFARVDTQRDTVWLNGVRGGTSAITGTDVETFAEFFGISVLSLLTGEFETVEATIVGHDLDWSKDGTTATDKASGRVFNLTDGQLSREVARRVLLLCPAETTVEQMLDKCCIDEKTTWFEAVQNGTRNFAEDYIEALAEFLSVTEFVLLSGEGLDLPEEIADEGASAEEADELEPVVALVEPTAQQPEVDVSTEEAAFGSSAAESRTDVGAVDEPLFPTLEKDVQRAAAFQEHFKQRLVSVDFDLLDGITLRDFLAATQAPAVDWCNIYHTMTKEGAETLEKVSAIAERFDAGDATLNMDIFAHVLSLALKRQ